MATFDLGNVPSPIAQQMRLAQLREAQNPNLALQRQIQQAVELQRIQQQSPEGQLALKIQEAQLNSALQNQDFRQQQQGLQLEAMRRAIPTDLESALRQATQQIQARQLGVLQAPQITGQPMALPALPVSEAVQRALSATPDRAPLVEETISPLEAPIQIGPRQVFDPSTARAMQEQSRLQALRNIRSEEAIKQENELQRINERAKSKGFKTYVNPLDSTDTLSLDPTQAPPTGYVPLDSYIKSTKASGGSGGIKATGEEKQKFREGIGVLREIKEANKVANEIQKTGKFPGGTQVAINQFLAQRPQDIPGAGLVPGLSSVYAAFQNQVRGAQTPQSRDLQMRRAYLASTILRMQAGLSQTIGEAININPYTPSDTDTFEVLSDKLKRLESTTTGALKDFRLIYPELRDISVPGLEDQPTGQTGAQQQKYLPGTILNQNEGGVLKRYQVDQRGIPQEIQ